MQGDFMQGVKCEVTLHQVRFNPNEVILHEVVSHQYGYSLLDILSFLMLNLPSRELNLTTSHRKNSPKTPKRIQWNTSLNQWSNTTSCQSAINFRAPGFIKILIVLLLS